MATLTQLTLDGDGTIASVIIPDTLPATFLRVGGSGQYRRPGGVDKLQRPVAGPLWFHCNSVPDGASSDYAENDNSEKSGAAWFSLTGVDSDLVTMLTLDIDVDVWAETPVANDSINLTARIAAGNESTTYLTNETSNLGTHTDTTRTQRNVAFAGLAGTKAQWDAAYIRFTWTYSKVAAGDDANLRLYGCDIDGTYAAAGTFQAAWAGGSNGIIR